MLMNEESEQADEKPEQVKKKVKMDCSCTLVDKDMTNKVVAKGTILQIERPNCFVSIDKVINNRATLPVPTVDKEDTVELLRKAVGTRVLWPYDHVIPSEAGNEVKTKVAVKDNQKSPKRRKTVKNVVVKNTRSKTIEKILSEEESDFAKLAHFCLVGQGSFTIKNAVDVYGSEYDTFLAVEVFQTSVHEQPLTSSCIAAYISWLVSNPKIHDKGCLPL